MRLPAWTLWRFAAILSVLFFQYSARADVLDSCWKASNFIKSSRQSILYEEEGRRYFSFGVIEYGVKEDGESGFIKINGIDIGVEAVKFERIEARNHKFNIGAKDLGMLQGEQIKIKFKSEFIYCLALPFAGLGGSGSYAKYKAVLAIPRAAKSGEKIRGIIGGVMQHADVK